MGVRTTTIILVSSLCFCGYSKAQVYNYVPFTFENMEINPAVVARSPFNNRIGISHTQELNGTTSGSLLHYSHFFKSSFTGIGLALNRVSYGSKHAVYSASAAMAYRTIVGDRMTVRLGALLRHVHTYSNSNVFDYYSIKNHAEQAFSGTQQFVNWSLMLGEPDHSNYAFFSMQNITTPWSKRDTLHQFGSQQTWEIGNLLKVLGARPNNRLTYSGRRRIMPDREVFEHYINLRTPFLRINRKLSTLVGGRFGWSQDDFVHLAPAFILFSEQYVWTIAYNHHLSTNGALKLPSSIQASFTYIFQK